MDRGRLSRPQLLVALIASLLLAMASAGPALAHAQLLESSPEAGAALDAPPTEVMLTFDEPVEPTGQGLVLTDGEGTEHVLDVQIGPDTGQLRADLPQEAAPGEHVVSWNTVARDGHVQSDSLTYTVGALPEDEDQSEEGPIDEAGAGDEQGETVFEEPTDAGDDDLAPDAADTDTDEGGAGWLIPVVVLVIAAIAAGALLLTGRRRTAPTDEA